jgi:hypothetical protein
MENSIRYQRLQAAVLSVYEDRLFSHDDLDSLVAMSDAGTELLLNHFSGDISDRKGFIPAAQVAAFRPARVLDYWRHGF